MDKPLTGPQRWHLGALLAAGALDEATAIETGDVPHEPLNAVVLGALRNKGLVVSRGRRDRARSWTVYWLTAAGRDEAMKEIFHD